MRKLDVVLFTIAAGLTSANAGYAEDVAPGAASAEAPPPVVAPPVGPRAAEAILHVESPVPVAVQQRTSEGAPWTAFCASPCDRSFDPSAQYRIAGDGVRPSTPFEVSPRADGSSIVRVTPGTNGGFYTGVGLLAGGGALIVAGAIVAVASSGSDSRAAETRADDGQTSNKHTNLVFVASALVVSGVAIGVVGGAKALGEGRTRVSGDARPVRETPPARGAVRETLRLEARRELAPTPAAPVVAIPLVQGSFLAFRPEPAGICPPPALQERS